MNKIQEQIPLMTTEELWRQIINFKEEGTIKNQEFNEIKYGKNKLKIDIRQYIEYLNGDERNIKFDHKNQRYRIQGRWLVTYTQFQDEFEKREGKMMKILNEIYSDQETQKPRM